MNIRYKVSKHWLQNMDIKLTDWPTTGTSLDEPPCMKLES